MPAPVRPVPPEECAQCGEPIPRNAHACPSCGADERTGWRETSIYDGLDLPEDDAETSAENEFSSTRQRRSGNGLRWYWVATLIVVLVILVLSALGLRP